MNETKSTVKTVLSFVLVLVLIVGAIFGIDVPYDEGDLDNMGTELPVEDDTTIEDEQPETDGVTDDVPVVETPVEEDTNEELPDDTEDEIDVPVEDTEDATQGSTPTGAETNEDEVVDNSAAGEVADTTEEQTDATEEGDVENA